jgi:hypothetical protein
MPAVSKFELFVYLGATFCGTVGFCLILIFSAAR